MTAALTNHFTRAEATANFVAFLAQANTYTDDQLVGYSTAAEMTQAIADALVPYRTIVHRIHRCSTRGLLHVGANGQCHRGGGALSDDFLISY